MERQVIKIDEALCNGCALCVPNCHEGAIQIIDQKARLISDLMCDGLGACIGHCPQGAITIETREAEPYDETKVMRLMIEKGENTVIAHLKHLKEHNETGYLNEGVEVLKQAANLPFNLEAVLAAIRPQAAPFVVSAPRHQPHGHAHGGGGCPGSQARTIARPSSAVEPEAANAASELQQWPVQLHLLNPAAAYFKNADVLLAADCVACAMGNFHSRFLKGKTLAIACPKLDKELDVYKAKITAMIDQSNINTLTVAIMQVPCCRGLLQIAQDALADATRKVPVKLAVVSVEGNVIEEKWL